MVWSQLHRLKTKVRSSPPLCKNLHPHPPSIGEAIRVRSPYITDPDMQSPLNAKKKKPKKKKPKKTKRPRGQSLVVDSVPCPSSPRQGNVTVGDDCRKDSHSTPSSESAFTVADAINVSEHSSATDFDSSIAEDAAAAITDECTLISSTTPAADGNMAQSDTNIIRAKYNTQVAALQELYPSWSYDGTRQLCMDDC